MNDKSRLRDYNDWIRKKLSGCFLWDFIVPPELVIHKGT